MSPTIDLIKYDTGGLFTLHKDYLIGGALNKNLLTLNLYPNELEKGGQLEIYDSNFSVSHRVVPKSGTAVIYDMDTYHEA